VDNALKCLMVLICARAAKFLVTLPRVCFASPPTGVGWSERSELQRRGGKHTR